MQRNRKHGTYRAGDFYRICDRTGFKVYASETSEQWDGLITRQQSWEARQPQDFVKGVRDDQNVPDPRPRQVDMFITGTGPALFLADTNESQGILSMQWQTVNGVSSFFVRRELLSPQPSDYPSNIS